MPSNVTRKGVERRACNGVDGQPIDVVVGLSSRFWGKYLVGNSGTLRPAPGLRDKGTRGSPTFRAQSCNQFLEEPRHIANQNLSLSHALGFAIAECLTDHRSSLDFGIRATGVAEKFDRVNSSVGPSFIRALDCKARRTSFVSCIGHMRENAVLFQRDLVGVCELSVGI